MAHERNIIIQNKSGKSSREITYRTFYGPLDKGSSKPSFCYPKRKEALQEEVDKMQKAIDNGHISPERAMEAKINLNTKKKRLDDINAQEAVSRKKFEDNKDEWMVRRKELAEEIAALMPTEKEVQKRRVNPHLNLQREKAGGLEEKKREFMVISRLAGEDSNIANLQRETA